MSYFTAKQIGEMLAKSRIAAGLSQMDMARRLNRGKTTIQNWESGTYSPHADDLMDWFTACGTSPLAPMQEMLHPELYRQSTSAMTDEDLDAALAAYFAQAPRIVKEMILFIAMGKHGSYPPAVFAEVCANLHTPLYSKVNICGQVLDSYKWAVATGADPVPDEVQPPVELLHTAYEAGKTASQNGEQAYTAKRGEEP